MMAVACGSISWIQKNLTMRWHLPRCVYQHINWWRCVSKKTNAESNPLTTFHRNLPSSSVPPSLFNQYALTTKLKSVYSLLALKTLLEIVYFLHSPEAKEASRLVPSLVCILKRAANSSSFSNMRDYLGQLPASPHTRRASPCWHTLTNILPRRSRPLLPAPGEMGWVGKL